MSAKKPVPVENDVFTVGDAEVAKFPPEELIDLGKTSNQIPITIGIGQGEWYHVGFTMCTSVAGPALLGLPYAMSLLGWAPGIIVMVLGFCTTYWTSRIVASFHDYGGKRHLRYRDLASAIYGPRIGPAIIWPCQWANLIGSNISIFIQAGLSFKAVYVLAGGDSLTLTEFIAISGGIAMLFTQLPTMHSLRRINAVALTLTVTFTMIAIAVSIYQTAKYDLPRDYSVPGASVDKVFGVFNGIVVISFAFGNTIIPEIQATAKPPAAKTMYKAIKMLYAELTVCYFPAAIIGYAAYGSALNTGGGSFLPFFQAGIPDPDYPNPKWALILINLLTLFNALIGITLYNAPVMEHFETKYLQKADSALWSFGNWVSRTLLRCGYIFLLALIAAMFPYFGDFLALIGALGVTPIDFVFPLSIYLYCRKPQGFKRIIAWALLILYTIIGTVGAVAAIRGIALDANNYSLFPDLPV